MRHHYVIVGGGLAAASAIEGIRARDPEGSILLVARENHPPYHRPPLSKGLWFGKTTLDQIAVHDSDFYARHGVELLQRREVVELDPDAKRVWDERGVSHEYEKLLLATGGRPRTLHEPGDVDALHYFRSLEDYQLLCDRLDRVQHVLVVGGGFIAIEMAAALRHHGQEVTFLYPSDHPLHKVLPRDLGAFVADDYRQRGVETVSNDQLVQVDSGAGMVMGRTRLGNTISTQLVLVGIGIEPNVELADAAGLDVAEGIVVDAQGRTSHPDVFAAGDVAEFTDPVLGERRRVEHWDHARAHGRLVGENMAGGDQAYAGLPMFYSDFFDLGWEAVGDVDSRLDVEAVWKEPNRTGILFYLRDQVVRGVLLWNVWDKVEWARGLIRQATPASRETLVALANAEML